MKSATLPPVRVEPALREAVEAVLDEGESLADFVSSCVRDGVAWRRNQDAFLTRARAAVEQTQREGTGVSPTDLLQAMRQQAAQARIKARRAP